MIILALPRRAPRLGGSLQVGKAVPVIAVTSVAANVVTIAAGPVVFGEPLPSTRSG